MMKEPAMEQPISIVKQYLFILILALLSSCQGFKSLTSTKPKAVLAEETPAAASAEVSEEGWEVPLSALTHGDADLELSDEAPMMEATSSAEVKNTKAVTDYCQKIDKSYTRYGWGRSNCENYQWHHVRNSVQGDPLMWVVFGDEAAHRRRPKDTTLLLCGQHGDEITPIKFCFDTIHHLSKLKNSKTKAGAELREKLVVIVPLVNPDSYFSARPSRTNARGVDVNRNFPTRDWGQEALNQWKRRYSGDKRRYPGPEAISEPETLFQVNLIKRYNPSKIVSVHSPLTLLDYDGPDEFGSGTTGGVVGARANQLLIQMSKSAKGYRIKNYPYFPGSLGNYAGNERNIPTYTLELPSSDNRRHKEFWLQFKGAMTEAILHDMRSKVDVAGRPDLSEEAGAN